MVKTLGKEIYGLGTTAKGLEVINNYMNKIGIQTDKCSIADGSGLSRLNMISPIGLNILLNEMSKNKYKDTFRKSLSTPNEEGTLKRRFLNTLAEKNIFAKTGSMNNVNNFTVPQNVVRNIQDLIAMRLASFSRRQSYVVPK